MSSRELVDALRRRVAGETPVGPGGWFTPGNRRMALAYPSPYRAGMSSLGFQRILALLRGAGIAAERVFLPDDPESWRRTATRPASCETFSALGSFPLIAVSLAYELEIAGLIELLDLAGIPPRVADRTPGHPKILLGGPISMANPEAAAPFVDAMLLGEGEDTAVPGVQAFFDAETTEAWFDAIAALPGGWVPGRGGPVPAIARASDDELPARSAILAPDAELSSMFLLEGERGCHRQCTFCVMRRSTNGGMRLVEASRILDLIPDQARKVGLVGAAISDHPRLPELLDTLVESGRQIGISSLRADRVKVRPQIARRLRQSGARTLTVASDGASERLRKTISKGTTEEHLLACGQIAAESGFETFKVYMMVGLPGETDADIDELIQFSLALASASRGCRVALGVAPFVPKRNTPLDGAPFAGIPVVESRLSQLSRGLRGRVEVRPTSARWAWVEAVLAQGTARTGEAVYRAWKAGGRFTHYKAAFAEIA
jgi:radical SAM superfamily enzyme YgiQ (UPF0313 family)